MISHLGLVLYSILLSVACISNFCFGLKNAPLGPLWGYLVIFIGLATIVRLMSLDIVVCLSVFLLSMISFIVGKNLRRRMMPT